jgi:hypothetical protein
MPADSLDICNKALAKIVAKPIADMDENSLEARECRRFYPQVISNMLEGPHEWGFSTQRVTLATVTNDRPDEWLYAYQLPSNCASPIRVLPNFDGLGIAVPVPLPGQPYAEAWAAIIADFQAEYILDGEIIYTNEVNATLEYIVNDITGLRVSQLFIQAVILKLASELAMPVKKDSAREKDLLTQAEIAEQRAIADDRNREPASYGNYIPENIAARHGAC